MRNKSEINLIIIPSKVWYNAVLYQLPDDHLLHTAMYIQESASCEINT